MKIKKMNGFRNVMLTTVALVLALSSVDGFSQTKFKKVIKDGKVTYLPVDNAGTKTNKKPSTNSAQTNSKKSSGGFTVLSGNTEKKITDKKVAKDPVKQSPKDIVLFESNQCNECRRIRRFFYKNKIAYTRKDIDLSKKFRHQLATKTGGTVTPALYIGKKRLDDLSSKNLEKELGTQQTTASTSEKIDRKKYNKSLDPNILIDGKLPKNRKPLDSSMQ